MGQAWGNTNSSMEDHKPNLGPANMESLCNKLEICYCPILHTVLLLLTHYPRTVSSSFLCKMHAGAFRVLFSSLLMTKSFLQSLSVLITSLTDSPWGCLLLVCKEFIIIGCVIFGCLFFKFFLNLYFTSQCCSLCSILLASLGRNIQFLKDSFSDLNKPT